MNSRARIALGLVLVVAASLIAAPAVAQNEPTVENPIIVESFDGTPIVATLMLPAGASDTSPVPVILYTHGWGGTRITSATGTAESLLEKGYAVFTWDARGFGDSGGEANIDSVEFEVKDVQALMDYLAGRPEIELDKPGDPRMGWIGGSYAGGIQLQTAGIDHRVDAIVPEIAWADLPRSLTPNGVFKRNWNYLLYGSGAATGTVNGLDSPAGPQTGVYAPEIHQAFAEINATGTLSGRLLEWFEARSTILRTPDITAPTMLVQGTVDTLFPLEEAFDHYKILKRNGVPVKLMTYCGGHTGNLVHPSLGANCPGGTSGYPDGGDGSIYEARRLAWLDRYVKGLKVSTGPELEWQAQDGYYYGGTRFPLPATKMVSTETISSSLAGPGTTGGDGPLEGNPAPQYEQGAVAASADVFSSKHAMSVVGIPRVELKGTVNGLSGILFLKLVDVGPDGEAVTVNDQTMPLRLEGGAFEVTVDLHGVTWLLQPGHTLQLEVSTGSTQYDFNRMGPYSVDFEATTYLPLAPAPTSKAV
ncbi:MAG TPA: alpha/beta fold hydrolase [Actinomycetota bacterium]|nr:alpha/beta fold hydrolase [Actinomycetota bacterium]